MFLNAGAARRAAVPFALVLLLGLTLLSTAPATKQADAADIEESFKRQVVEVKTPTRASKAALQALRVNTDDGLVSLDLTEHAGHDYIEVVLNSPADLAALEANGFEYDVRIADLDQREAQNRELDAQYAAAVARSALPSGRTTYRRMEDYNRDMRRLAKNHPKLVKRFALDLRTVEGAKIWALEIGKNIKGRRDGRPVFAMFGLHHAREWPSGENTIEFAFDLIRKYGESRRITRLLRKSRVIIVPVVNVDGFRQSVNDGLDYPGAGNSSNEFKRKNCRVTDGQTQPPGPCEASKSPLGFGIGVDLNRNYGAFWGGPGASEDKADPTYRGPSRFSEPETRAVRRLIRSRHVTTLITNHTYSNLILRPNGVNPQTIGPDGLPVGEAPNEDAMKRLGRKMANQNGYRNIHGWELYDTTGTTEDWSYNATGGYGYTFEIGADEFHPPFEEVVKEYRGRGEYRGKGNRAAFLLALENAVNSNHHSVLGGTAPKGAKLMMMRRGLTTKWVGSFRDAVFATMRVGRKGTYRWHANPSTRPLVEKSRYQVLGRAMAREVYQGVTPPNLSTDQIYKVTKDADLLDIKLDWPTPDDLDLYVYKKVDGTFKEVGSSTGFVGEKERVMVDNPRKGQVYRLRVTNFASGSPQWTLTAGLHNTTTEYKDPLFEVWTVRCIRDGETRQTKQVHVERGGRVKVDFNRCGR